LYTVPGVKPVTTLGAEADMMVFESGDEEVPYEI
jgi:hypothetical protein